MTEERIYEGGLSLVLSNEELTEALGDVIVRLNKLQDAHLGPVLESSAVLVELRRIADALERHPITVDVGGAASYIRTPSEWGRGER